MQGSNQDQTRSTASGSESAENIVSLFGSRKAKDAAETTAEKTEASSESFEDVMRRNAENAERLRKERLKANSSVLKSYRIKN